MEVLVRSLLQEGRLVDRPVLPSTADTVAAILWPALSDSNAPGAPLPVLGREVAAHFTLGQAWRARPEPGLLATRVEARVSDGRLHVLAELIDDDVFNHATAHNQRTWELGDVFEIFVRRDDAQDYTEVHVTPDNIRLHLRFADFDHHARIGDIDEVAADPDLILSTVDRTGNGWRVRATVPIEAGVGDLLRLSFCRYDANRGRSDCILSSSSPHPVLAFHRPLEWTLCRIVE